MWRGVFVAPAWLWKSFEQFFHKSFMLLPRILPNFIQCCIQIRPAWHAFKDVPLHSMWADNSYWLPQVRTLVLALLVNRSRLLTLHLFSFLLTNVCLGDWWKQSARLLSVFRPQAHSRFPYWVFMMLKIKMTLAAKVMFQMWQMQWLWEWFWGGGGIADEVNSQTH